MILINIILALFVGLIIHHIMSKINIIEGLDDDSTKVADKDENSINNNSTEYTAAKVNVELGELKKDLSRAKERVEKMHNNMKELTSMKSHMNINTNAIVGLQKAIAEIETEMENLDAN
jgi:archaellum component FlaC